MFLAPIHGIYVIRGGFKIPLGLSCVQCTTLLGSIMSFLFSRAVSLRKVRAHDPFI